MSKTNLQAFLDMIATSEGTKGLGDDGYNVIVGGALFHDYARHPGVKVWLPRWKIYSTAAGRYQVLQSYWMAYKHQLNLPDFGHDSQDRIAIQLIRECRALDDVEAGRFDVAVSKCKSRWASLPGAGYGQRENSMDDLRREFVDAGGVVAA